MPNDTGRIFLGVMGGAVHETRLSSGRLERHVLGGTHVGVPNDQHMITVAGSRAGKGRAVILPNLITYPGSVLAIDPKGDLARLTADWRADMLGQRVVVLDPFGGDEGRGPAAWGAHSIPWLSCMRIVRRVCRTRG